MKKTQKDIIKEMDSDLPDYVVEAIVGSPLHLLKQIMKNNIKENLMIKGFGKFIYNHAKERYVLRDKVQDTDILNDRETKVPVKKQDSN